MDRVVLAWSGGKDAAYALYRLREHGFEVVELLTTIDEQYDRSSMHGVRRHHYDRQASALGVPLNPVVLPSAPSNEAYDEIMAREIAQYRDRNVSRLVFGDLFLESVRSYREDRLAGTEIDGYWPLWGLDTTALATTVLDLGFRATVVAVDGDVLDESYAGREFDEGFLADLPPSVDPCGENGEFHTFVWDGPIFETPVPVEPTRTVTREIDGTDFHYAALRSL